MGDPQVDVLERWHVMEARIGLRQTFRTKGLILTEPDGVRARFELDEDVRAEVYVGTKPPRGICRRTGGGTAAPGEEFESGAQFVGALKNAEGESEVLLEVVCHGPLPKRGEASHRIGALESVEEGRGLQWAVDYVTGVLSLLYGPQLAFELIDEEVLRIVDGEVQGVVEWPAIYYMPEITLSSLELLSQHSRPTAGEPAKGRDQRAVDLALHWWQKCLREHDPIDKFFYCFVAMECVLGVGFRSSGTGRARKPVQQRFSDFAAVGRLGEFERDISLFREVCRVRNSLVHAGNYQVLAADGGLRELIGPFEDLVKRCLRHVVLD